MQLWDGAHAFFRGNEEKVQAALTEHLQWRAASPHPGVPHVDAIPVALVAQELGAGSLYVHAFSGVAPIPMAAPFGGAFLILGWLLLAAAGIALVRQRRD